MEINKVNNTEYVFTFLDADYSIGNLLQKEIINYPEVVYVGYIKNHPLETKMKLKIISKDKNPKEILNIAFTNLIDKMNEIYGKLEQL
jgi:DNA-directed RNA polymerase subunit L